MVSKVGHRPFDAVLGCLLQRETAQLAARMSDIPGLIAAEQATILAAVRDTILTNLHGKLGRLLVLELNAARVEGRLNGATAQARWDDFMHRAAAPGYWESLSRAYPSLLSRVAHLVANACEAGHAFALRWAADRAALEELCGAPCGDLVEITFAKGDPHRGGHTVALLKCEGGRLVYKPRPLGPDRRLREFLTALEEAAGLPIYLTIPRVVDRGAYGWCECIEPGYADDHAALSRFYQGLGHSLAVMRLIGGSDLHSENLIACNDRPVLVDCETLFTPALKARPSGLGDASDIAGDLAGGTVLATGLLPHRTIGLGLHGRDVSGIGALPGEQPMVTVPDIIDAGTDRAHMGTRQVPAAPAQNLPAPKPTLAAFWPDVLVGFDRLNAALRKLDANGGLRRLLAPFETCQLRLLARSTESYAELGRMLWHPVSLHDEATAIRHVHDLLTKMAENAPLAPADPSVIDDEIAALLIGDIPHFETAADACELCWLSRGNLVEEAYRNWLRADFDLERNFAQASLVSAYLDEGGWPDEVPLPFANPRTGNLDRRRRAQAAAIMRTLVETAIRGKDRTASWIAPMLTETGWTVRALGADLYTGLSGIALAAGAYMRECDAGRADIVDGVPDLFEGLLESLRAFSQRRAGMRRRDIPLRPLPPGGYLGLGSQIWANLVLTDLGLDGADGLGRAIQLAQDIPASVAADDVLDVLSGKAGAIVPLLMLAALSGDAAYLNLACSIGDALCEAARFDANGRACWAHPLAAEGMGGFSHGVTGIGWALAKLAAASGKTRYRKTADAAFAFEESLFDEAAQNWRDMRKPDGPAAFSAWCNGAVGIALAHLDLDPALDKDVTQTILRRAVQASWPDGMLSNHGLCHGALGTWELLHRAAQLGVAPQGLDPEQILAIIVTSLEDNGPNCGVFSDAVVPGLLAGLGGIAFQLLRASPESDLPSVLTLQGGKQDFVQGVRKFAHQAMRPDHTANCHS